VTYGNLLEWNLKNPLSLAALKAYYASGNFTLDQELNMRDYKVLDTFVSYALGELQYCVRNKKVPNLGFIAHNIPILLKRAEFFFAYSDSERVEQLEIAREIRTAGGVINYLGMTEDRINSLNELHRDTKPAGVPLFLDLLRQKHAEINRIKVKT
jgi:hypothetical protein